MKIRQGFVSNSSSSSFCIIGVQDENLIRSLAKKENKNFYDFQDEVKTIPQRGCSHVETSFKFCPECGKKTWIDVEIADDREYDDLNYGYCKGNIVDFYGSDGIEYAGIEIEQMLETKNLSEIKKYFIDLISKKFELNIPIKKVKFYYGEVGNG